jgi:hypothetical protein
VCVCAQQETVLKMINKDIKLTLLKYAGDEGGKNPLWHTEVNFSKKKKKKKKREMDFYGPCEVVRQQSKIDLDRWRRFDPGFCSVNKVLDLYRKNKEQKKES